MNKHLFWMIIGCRPTLLLISPLPVFAITKNYTFLIFIDAIFACHLMMPLRYGNLDKHYVINKTDNHEPHHY